METDLSFLNPQQRDAILQSVNSNVVLSASAGSGKTRVLITRTQYLVNDMGVFPESIMLITFTNKAAGEILDRMKKVTPDATKMWIGTFHRICTRLIRMFGDNLGIKNFTILNPKDAKEIIKNNLTAFGIDYNQKMITDIQRKISDYKNNLRKPTEVLADEKEDKIIASIYQEYQNICWKRRTFDFDDLIIYAILLLSSYPNVLKWVHDHIHYVMVDESQDTNSAQYILINLLCGNNNVMLVGDTNQSIYRFRNARPELLQNFAQTHQNTIILKLEQNYRSTKTIISAANAVIENNGFGMKLTMFSENEQGEPINILNAYDSRAEARWIACEILMNSKGKNLKDYAVIYRANFQSRILEEEFTKLGVAYTIFGSTSFYSRKEVRDLLAYCKLYINPNDIDSFKRILGTLKGVGNVTQSLIIDTALASGVDFKQAIENYYTVATKQPSIAVKHRLNIVSSIINGDYKKCSDLVSDVLVLTDYQRELQQDDSEDSVERLAIIQEFKTMLLSVEEQNNEESMTTIIDQIALLSDAKGAEKEELNAVKFMTAHSSKGLEFPNVFIVGCEDGVFPHSNSMGTVEGIEEERRLFYVAMTRAEKTLYLTRGERRNNDGQISTTKKSRFLKEIPKNLTVEVF